MLFFLLNHWLYLSDIKYIYKWQYLKLIILKIYFSFYILYISNNGI